ncbi:MAG: flagellar biosynthesis protein FlhF [Bradymonadia bacterium]|jgi:flagellar biosynthesis protein FlhF
MEVRKYRVRKMSEGLERIKREMGPDAVILSTTRLIGQANGETMEIAVAPPQGRSKPPPPTVTTNAPVLSQPNAGVAESNELVRELLDQVRDLQSEVRHLRIKGEVVPSAPRITRESAERSRRPDPRLALDLSAALDAGEPTSSVTRTMSFLYQTLKLNGVAEPDIEDIVAEAWEQHQQRGRGPNHLVRLVEEAIASRVSSSVPLWHQSSDKPQLAVLLGPTGVGKTTTIAKLAAHAKLVGHRRVGVVCADTYRIGGVYQLDSYARLIGVPMRVASTLVELRGALHELKDCDLILVDTAGRNPWSGTTDGSIPHDQYRELEPEYDVQLHVCLSATTRTDDLVALVNRYEDIQPSALIFTKADEAQGVGGLLSASIAAGLPISHVCHGQGVPDDVACPTPSEVARWVRTGHPNRWTGHQPAHSRSGGHQ